MKKSAVLIVAGILFLFGGCGAMHIPEERTTAQAVDERITAAVAAATSDVFASTSETVLTDASDESIAVSQTTAAYEEIIQTLPEESATVAEDVTAGATTELCTEESTVEDENIALSEPSEFTESITEEKSAGENTVTVQETSFAEENTGAQEVTSTEEKTTVQQPSDEIELSISMPDKNGTMVTDKNSENEFIRIVNKEKGIAAELLVAVYSVPESGQNYVFEFYDENDFSSENIRRVYLIDMSGNITSVTATESSERENISPVENWFCMNVLIKEIIYPAVSEGV